MLTREQVEDEICPDCEDKNCESCRYSEHYTLCDAADDVMDLMSATQDLGDRQANLGLEVTAQITILKLVCRALLLKFSSEQAQAGIKDNIKDQFDFIIKQMFDINNDYFKKLEKQGAINRNEFSKNINKVLNETAMKTLDDIFIKKIDIIDGL